MKSARAALGDSRVILHIDLDAFYAQVEQRLNNIPKHVPCAVQQWDGLIAVNYPARDKGITRHMRVAEAKSLCPELVLVHVETIGAAAAPEEEGDQPPPNADNNNQKQQQQYVRQTQKACLERYRRANAEILQILHKLVPTAVIEKASIDEVYIDITALVDKELADSEDDNNSNAGSGAFSWGSIVIGGPLDPGSEFERRLSVGSQIACRLRGAIKEQLGYTSSAGIATNKLLAKIGSAMHKPDQQTIIPPKSVENMMEDLPLKKIKNFGGKLGQQLEAMGCTTAGEVGKFPFEVLVINFGAEKAKWIVDAVRGKNEDPVEEKERPKSMLAAKSFTSTSDLTAIQRWFGILASELARRMIADEEAFTRRPRTLSVHYRGGDQPGKERNRQAAMPRLPTDSSSEKIAEILSNAGFEIFKTRCAAEALPCNRLALSAGDFVDLPAQGKSAITRFFAVKKQDENEKEEGSNKRPLPNEEMMGKEASPVAKVPKMMDSMNEVDASRRQDEKQEEKPELPEELLGVDIADQKRLLKELEMLKALEDAKKKREPKQQKASGGGGGGNKKGNNNQPVISKFFVKKT